MNSARVNLSIWERPAHAVGGVFEFGCKNTLRHPTTLSLMPSGFAVLAKT